MRYVRRAQIRAHFKNGIRVWLKENGFTKGTLRTEFYKGNPDMRFTLMNQVKFIVALEQQAQGK